MEKISNPSIFSRSSSFLRKYGICLLPIICLFLAYATYSRFFLEFVETDATKTVLNTGLNQAEIMLENTAKLTNIEMAAVNNKAYAARISWSAMAYLHFCICMAAFIAGILMIFAATKYYARKVFIWILIPFTLYIYLQLFVFKDVGAYRLMIQLLQKTVQVAEYSGFPKLWYFANELSKLSFIAATLLAISAGLTLVDPKNMNARIVDNKTSVIRLKDQMSLLHNTLYVGTIVMISMIFFLSFTLRWSLVYIPDENIARSVEILINSQIISSGVYYTTLLALSYIPAAVIQHNRAVKLAEAKGQKETVDQQETWMKDNGLMLSPMDLLTRLAAIFGPLLAGSFSELFKLIQ